MRLCGVIFYLFLVCQATAGKDAPLMPMKVDYGDAATTRWLNKKVLETRLLDNMEALTAWVLQNSGHGKGQMTLTAERSKNGKHSLRLRSKTKEGTKPVEELLHGPPYGSVSVVRQFPGEDWSRFNRISFWVYPDLPGFRVVALNVRLHNSGKEKVPDRFGKDGVNHLLLRNNDWNHVVWEVAHLSRDKVTGIEIQYRLQGNEPEAGDTAIFDLDQLELQRVDADYYEGWTVAPGKIAFSHTGYQLGSEKSAVASGLAAKEFKLTNPKTGQAVLSKPIQTVTTHTGTYQLMDFSEVREPGTYIIQAGNYSTRPFRIDGNIWESTLWKAINFFYVERCGMDIPGSHRVCHRDWQAVHNDRKIAINGGWHDAGDLSQGFPNTSQAVYTMLRTAEKLRARREAPDLSARLIEEAKWGLDWILKTSFHDGFRQTGSGMDIWTNGIIGDSDDVIATAQNSVHTNLLAAATEATAYRVLKDSDPERATTALRLAEEDWRYGIVGLKPGTGRLDTISDAILAALGLAKATGRQEYGAKAVELAPLILNSQQRTYLADSKMPLAGFFYDGPKKEHILRYFHQGHEQAPIEALAALCDAFPNDRDWIKWYSAVALHSEYLKTMSKFTEPYGMLPASVYREDEYLDVPQEGGRRTIYDSPLGGGATREDFREQLLNGFQISDKYRVRLFPVWFGTKGNNGVILAKARALVTASRLRGDLASSELAMKQLQWAVGRNPFSQSLMFGEGYDFTPLYSAMSGDIVGALPVGIETKANKDVPYWPPANCFTYKEVWVHAVSRWMWVAGELSGPALVELQVAKGQAVDFRDVRTGRTLTVKTQNHAMFPAGNYVVSSNGLSKAVTLLPGGIHRVNLLPGRAMDFSLSQVTDKTGQVVITASVRGNGRHFFELRADNLVVSQPVQAIDLQPGNARTIIWRGKLGSLDAPWIGVVIADNDMTERKEVVGLQLPRS